MVGVGAPQGRGQRPQHRSSTLHLRSAGGSSLHLEAKGRGWGSLRYRWGQTPEARGLAPSLSLVPAPLLHPSVAQVSLPVPPAASRLAGVGVGGGKVTGTNPSGLWKGHSEQVQTSSGGDGAAACQRASGNGRAGCRNASIHGVPWLLLGHWLVVEDTPVAKTERSALEHVLDPPPGIGGLLP